MRYKYIAFFALIVMLIGVAGIYSGGGEETDNSALIAVPVEKTYYAANKILHSGMLVSEADFSKKVITYSEGEKMPEWLMQAAAESEVEKLLRDGGVVNVNLNRGDVVKKGMIVNLPETIDNKLVAIPISVTVQSAKNPEVKENGFVDIYLISNDNTIYHDDIYIKQGSTGNSGSSYKDTRVKKFATDVWIAKKLGKGESSEDESNGGEQKGSRFGDKVSTQIIYAFFNKSDLDTVIQAQAMGMFFISPVKTNMMPEKLSNIKIGAREVTPADIVSGAPLAEKKSKVLEIRGAKNAFGRH